MKRTILSALFASVACLCMAQSEKMVKWNNTVKKLADKTYEVHMTANIGGNYHLYAQQVGVDGPVATAFTFFKNPLVVLDGNVKEIGKVIKKFESAWSGNVNYYERTVDFIQVVKLKADVKTNLAGKVEFMVCDDKQCLPPSDVEIKIGIGG